LFEGKTQVLSFDLDIYNFINDENNLNIELFSISKDIYMYLLTFQAQQETEESPFAEPVMVYNNIKDGYGIFAGFSVYKDSILIPNMSPDYYDDEYDN